MDIYNPVYPGLYYFDTFTFTTLGTSGHRGPDSTKTYANAPWREGDFSIVDGQQQWTVPATGTYRIEAAGAYGATPGRVVSGDVDLNEGQVVSLLVGQQPYPLTANVVDNVTVGGGGGTFVTVGGKPLIVASGGDGGSTSNLFAPSNFSSFSYASAISGDGNTIAGIIKTTVYIYNKINGSWIQNNQTIQLPIVDGGDMVVNIVLDYTGVTLFINYGNSNYPLQNATYKVYKYSSVTKTWDVNGTVLLTNSLGPTLYSDLSGDGNTIIISLYNADAYVFRYSNGSWPYELFISSLGIGLSLSSDANTLASSSTSGQLAVFKYINGTWDAGVELGISYPYTIPVCSISGDGNTIVAQYGYTTNLTIVYKYTNGSWDSGTAISTGDLQYNNGPVDVNYDGSVVFYKWSNTKIGVYIDGTVNLINNGAIHLKCTSDGKQFIFSDGFVSGPDAVGNTSLFKRSNDSQPGSFSPFGSGSGFSGAGYLTDGQVSNPYFEFLKPQSYVDGGFGNTYWYGHKDKGGFGGGQTSLNLQTNISEITGFANVYPSINVQADAIALDSSGTVVIIGQAALSKATVFRYSEGQWDNGYDLLTWYSLTSSVALSSDSNTAVVGSFQGFIIFTYSGGSWTEQYNVFGGFENYFGYSLALNSTGTILFVGAPYSFFSSPYVSVYRLSESTWSFSEYLPMNIPGFGYSLSTSSDGNKVIVGVSFYNIFTEQTYGDTSAYVFTYADSVWDDGVSLTKNTNDNGTFGSSVAMNSDGNVALVGAPGSRYATLFTYTNDVWNPVKTFTEDVYNFGLAVKLTDNGTTQIIGSTSLVKIYKSDETYTSYGTCSILATGGNILTFPSLGNVIFENLNAPTTTCTANTAVEHGYPHNYQVQITGTSSFNGTWDIVTTSSNTFTFQAFGGPTVTSGYVSGTTTGISGGGGYTGSPGDGVSGATCYADPAVRNFTDLGATSNSAGYVTVSLVDPVPIKQTYDLKSTMTIFDVQVYNTFNWRRIVYSQGLDLFVILGRSDSNFTTSLYSKDGKLWYSGFYSRPLSGAAYGCLTWAPELGIFLATDTFPWFSSDGIHWTQDTSADNTSDLISITWIPFLRKFLGVTGLFSYPRGMSESSDGKTWSALQNAPVLYFSADETKSLMSSSDVVVVCDSIYVYSSTNGTDWDLTLTTSDTITSWAYGNGYFFVSAGFYYYYSKDGYTWQNGTYPIVYSFWGVAGTTTFLENSVMVTFPENSYISTDYINWTAYPNNLCAPPGEGMFSGTDYIGSVYTNKGYVVALLQRDVHLTVNGYVWIKAERPYIPAGPYLNSSYTGYAYSETSNVIVLTNSISIETLEKGVYYKNGSWKRIPGLDFYPQMCTWNPVSSLFELSETVSFDPFLETIVSGGQTSDWIVPSLLQTFYYQGLNNNLPLYKAFSLSGIIVDTYTGMGQPPPVSCDGTTFISSQESDTIRKTTDGVTWTEYNTTVTNIGDYLSFLISTIKYVSKYKLFFAFGFIIGPTYFEYQTSGIFTSVDGIEWTRVYSESFNVLLTIDSVLWDVNEDTFIIFYRNRNPTYFKLL